MHAPVRAAPWSSSRPRPTPAAATLALFLASALACSDPRAQVRYQEEVFTQVDVTSDIVYGSAFNQWSGVVDTLHLDLYQPTGDPAPVRAAMVLAYGGGFLDTGKAEARITQLATSYAKHGYVVVSIEYRLAQTSAQVQANVATISDEAGEDVKAAVRFLRSNATPWRIDSGRIGSLGISSGGNATQCGAYRENEGGSGNPGFASDVGATIILWGSNPFLADMEPGESPVCVVHGSKDRVVPYSLGKAIHDRAVAVGIPAQLHRMKNVGHSAWTEFFASHFDDSVAFLYTHLDLANINPTPGVTVTPTAGLVTTEAGGADSFTIVLETQPTADVTIGLSSSDPSEGTVSPPSVTFTAVDWDTPQAVSVTGADDLALDGDIPYTVVTTAAASSGAYNGLPVADVAVLNLDNEAPPAIQVTTVTPASMSAGSSVVVTITGSGFVDGVTVTFENGRGPAPGAAGVTVVSGSTITATISVGGGGRKGTRQWDLRVTNPGGSTGVLVDGFAVNK